MILDDLQSIPVAEGKWEISARVRRRGSEELRLWWRLPEQFAPAWPDGSPFVAAAQMWALEHGEDLSTELPVASASANKLEGLTANADPARPRVAEPPVTGPPPAHALTGCFFGLGVDSWFGALTASEDQPQSPPVTHLIFSPDLLQAAWPQEVRRARRQAVREAAATLDLELIEIETNLRRDLSSGQNRVTLACTGLALGLQRTLIPSNTGRGDAPGHPADRRHEMVDDLFSNERSLLVHYGDATRLEKIERIARSREALGALYVCGRKGLDTHGNCGRCEKCLRTMTGLHIAGALDGAPTFGNSLVDGIARVRAPLGHPGQWNEILKRLADSDRDVELAAAVRLVTTRHKVDKLARELGALEADDALAQLDHRATKQAGEAQELVREAQAALDPVRGNGTAAGPSSRLGWRRRGSKKAP